MGKFSSESKELFRVWKRAIKRAPLPTDAEEANKEWWSLRRIDYMLGLITIAIGTIMCFTVAFFCKYCEVKYVWIAIAAFVVISIIVSCIMWLITWPRQLKLNDIIFPN
ncbi:MAG: hypothetical protein ACM3KR_08210 [Deltaproteobacteria bacterium]